MTKDFYSFERVLRELQMEEEELKRLVSEGEIRAFRDQDKMKFKKEEVERFRGREGDSMETIDSEDIPEELVFDEDDADQEVGMATAAISDDSFLEEDDEPLELEEEPTPARRGRATAGPVRKPRVVVDEPEETEGALWTAATILVSVLVLLGVLVALDAVRSTPTGLTEGIMKWVGESFNDIKYT